MKTTLVLTDLSDNAAHAAETAVLLSQQLHFNVLLFNNFQFEPVAPELALVPYIVEEYSFRKNRCYNDLDQLSGQLKPLLFAPEIPRRPITIHQLYLEGYLADNIAQIITERDIQLITMGARSGSTLDHLLAGSDTKTVITKATVPVMVIPNNANSRTIRKIVFATEFEENDIKHVRQLLEWAEPLGALVEVVHINVFGKKNDALQEKEMRFRENIGRIQKRELELLEISGKDALRRLERYCTETNANLLAMSYRKHSLLHDLVKQSLVLKVLNEQVIPVLIFPKMAKNDL